jgi:hypothetical protein
VPVEFGPPADELSQGDLFEAAPTLYVRSLDFMVQTERGRFKLEHQCPPALDPSKEHPANAVAARRFGLVLTHDCEIDKDTTRASFLLVQVRPISAVHADDRSGFENYTRHRAFYLPPGDYLPEGHYADLRVITTLRQDLASVLERVASMNEDGRRMLREHIFRFFTRRYLPADWMTWEEDVADGT